MKFEEALHELRNEPVAAGDMVATLSAIRHPSVRRAPAILRRGLPFAIGIAIAIGFAVYPWRKSDMSWAQAKANLFEAKMVHMKITAPSPAGSGDVWIHDEKIFESNGTAEYRCNGKLVSQKVGQITSFWPKQKHEIMYLKGTVSFWSSIQRIKSGNATRGTAKLNGKTYRTYIFNSGSVVTSTGDRKTTYVGDTFLTAYVDEDVNRIVRIVQDYKSRPSSKVPTDRIQQNNEQAFYNNLKMTAEIDYPQTIEDSIFDPPAGAFDRNESKNVVAAALASSLGEAEAAGQKVKLHGLFFDGTFLNVIWSGCPADFNSKDRFRIEKVGLSESFDVRCLSSGKATKPTTASVPFCLQSSRVTGLVPNNVTLTMPVFALDKARPYPGNKAFHTKKVGEVTFKNVPVTPIVYIQTYQRQLGLTKTWW